MRNKENKFPAPHSDFRIPDLYSNRETAFQFRGRSYNFSLSHGLFSSADIDTGSRFLLKVFSGFLDHFSGKRGPGGGGAFAFDGELPFTVLDAGSGTGVLGICAAGALSALSGGNAPLKIRAQDRDELAKVFTEYNAAKNGLAPEIFEAHTEPLLAGPPGQGWDLILTNIPAKAGLPVLEDFIRRSAGVLKKDGLVFLVAVNTLAGFFRSRIGVASLLKEETGREHTVFVYGRKENGGEGACDPLIFDESFPAHYPFYFRNKNDYEMEGITYHLDTVHGAPDFDRPGGAIEAAAKLAVKINLAGKINPGGDFFLYEDAQGHFAVWLTHYLTMPMPSIVLSGRNILALAAAKHNLWAAKINSAVVPSAAPGNGRDFETATGCDLVAFFPETIPMNRSQTADSRETAWEGLGRLCAEGGIVIAAMGSSDAERFDRKKDPAFVRLGDVRRNGFRAIAYRKSGAGKSDAKNG